ncbi:MAG: response regulator [Acidobacteria bacterium]|nr:response regulator [Acidobacteriota bacterium]
MTKLYSWFFILQFGAALLAQELPKRIRAGGGYSVPWAYLGPDGTPTGFYIEAMKEAARREGLAFEAVFRKDGPEKSLQSGEIDLWSAAVPTEERRKILYFTEPWWSQDHYLGVLASGPIQGLNDLAGKVVVYATTPPFTADLREVLPGAKLSVMNDLRGRFHAVCDGEADAVLFHHETSLFALTGSNEMAECRERGLRLIPVGRPIMVISIASLPENKALADRMRKRLQEMVRDHTLAKLAASPLTGTQSLVQMLQAQQREHRYRLLELSIGSLLVVVVLVGIAYFRLRRANQRTRDALALAEKASRVKSEFLATMSHEMRTPLTAVLGYMDMLTSTPLRYDQRRYASEVKQATESLLTLMTSILGYARPGRRPPAEEETVDVPSVIDDCVAAVVLDAEAKGLTLIADISPTVPRRLRGDAVRVRQAVLNLLGNAVKFTASGWVRVKAGYREGNLICAVTDSGEGIPEEKRKAIFEPFTQIDSTDNRRYGGVGLGLAVVADIAMQLGGVVEVDMASSGGAQFTLRLPMPVEGEEASWLDLRAAGTVALLAEPSEAVEILAGYLREAGLRVEWFTQVETLNLWTPPGQGRVICIVDGASFGPVLPIWRTARSAVILLGRIEYLRGVSEESKSGYDDILPLPVAARTLRELLQPAAARAVREIQPMRRHVLVVDDNAVNRHVLTALLENLGCHVDTAKNGREALEAAKRERYTAILMDCQMPVMNGYEATREIRRLPFHGSDVPICGVSASLDSETRARCETSGMTEYLPKPLTLEMLQDLLTRMTAKQIIEERLQNDGK